MGPALRLQALPSSRRFVFSFTNKTGTRLTRLATFTYILNSCYDHTGIFEPFGIPHIMSALDVEALLDSTANAAPADQNGSAKSKDNDDRHKNERNDRRDRERTRDGSRDRDRDRKRRDCSRTRRETNGDKELIGTPTSDHGSAQGSVKKIVPTKEAAEMVISTEEMAVPAPDHEALIGTIVLVGIAGIEMN